MLTSAFKASAAMLGGVEGGEARSANPLAGIQGALGS